MSNKEIQEKYGIEPIMKEMWVWDDDKEKAELVIVLYRKTNSTYQFKTIDKNMMWESFKNASETNPNEKEPKVGDKGYFWDDENEFYLFDELAHRYKEKESEFLPLNIGETFKHFSHEKQPWMQ